MGIVCGASAFFLHKQTSAIPPWTVRAVRVIGAVAAYEALIILTQPGSTCLFPSVTGDGGPKETKTRIPAQITNLVLPSIVFAAGVLMDLIPSLVTDPIPTISTSQASKPTGNTTLPTPTGAATTLPPDESIPNNTMHSTSTSNPPSDPAKPSTSALVTAENLTSLMSFANSFLPTGTYTLFSVLIGQVVSSEATSCTALQKSLFYVMIGVSGMICFVLALTKRSVDWYKTVITNIGEKSQQAKFWAAFKTLEPKDFVRAVIALVVFGIVAVFTPPATTCLLLDQPKWVVTILGRCLAAGVVMFISLATTFRKFIPWLSPAYDETLFQATTDLPKSSSPDDTGAHTLAV